MFIIVCRSRPAKAVPQKRKYSLAEAVAAVNEDNEDDDAEFGGLSEAIEFVIEWMLT